MADAEWSATIVNENNDTQLKHYDKKAKIHKNVKIGPFCYIGPNVENFDEAELISNVHIEGNTKVEVTLKFSFCFYRN